MQTTEDDEDEDGEPGAVIYDNAAVRDLNATGRWAISEDRASVLRLTVEGSKRGHGIIASNYAQPHIDDKGTVDISDDTGGEQEIVSLGDTGGFGIELGAADRYLIPRCFLQLGRLNTRITAALPTLSTCARVP